MKRKYTRRTIDGRRRKVKIHRKSNGTYLVRKVGYKNRRD